jgi:hypothetical protein
MSRLPCRIANGEQAVETALSLMVLAAVALFAGAIYLWRARGLRKQALLMAVLAAVMAINVAIWTVPNDNGHTLVGTDLK